MKRPGMLSSIRLGSGTLTVQTELADDGSGATTVVDFCGKVLRRVKHVYYDGGAGSIEDAARRWHARVERDVHDSLAALKRPPASSPRRAVNPTAAELFILAVESTYSGDHESARALLEATIALLPENEALVDLRDALDEEAGSR
jgi:hypothetical protein